jgi:aminopeptidase
VAILRPDFGGGEVYFDGALIQKDGRFLPGELEDLNPSVL